jgi:uncharacterized RDD family membrane protein YckC
MQPPYQESPYQGTTPVQLQYVSVWPRFFAVLIDGILTGIVSGIISYPLGSSGSALSLIIALAYFIGMEATLGATLGKLALGLRVVKTDGTPISWGEAVVRNLLRIVDIFPYVIPYLLGAIFVWNSPTCQRLGDRAANTVVVRR